MPFVTAPEWRCTHFDVLLSHSGGGGPLKVGHTATPLDSGWLRKVSHQLCLIRHTNALRLRGGTAVAAADDEAPLLLLDPGELTPPGWYAGGCGLTALAEQRPAAVVCVAEIIEVRAGVSDEIDGAP